MNKTLLALTLILATAFADLANLNLATDTLTTTLGLQVYGSAASEALGTHVSDAGDFNWDGYPDYLVTGTGTNVYVVMGKSSARSTAIDLGDTAANLVSNYVLQITITGASGLTASAAGDVTRDGYDDIIIGYPGCLSGKGCGYVVFGRSGRTAYSLNPASDNTGVDLGANAGYFYIVRTTGSATTDAVGTSVAAAGDIDGDGFDDVMISMPGTTPGRVYIIRGKQFVSTATLSAVVRASLVDLKDIDTPANSEGFKISGETGKAIGRYVAYAGDVNGDKGDDIIIGSMDYAYIIYGIPHGSASTFADIDMAVSTTLVTIITGTGTAGDNFGKNVGAAGDLNDDGADDVFVTASGLTSNTGQVCIIWGNTAGTKLSATTCTSASIGTKGILITGGATADAFGTEADGVGDVNLDGIDDIVVGAPTSAGATPGKVYVIYGSKSLSTFTVTSLSASSTGIVITGKSNGDKFGTSISGVGNINADAKGVDDFIVGAPGATYSTRTTSGLAYEFYGVAKTITTTTTTGSGSRLGASLLVLVSFFVALIF